MFTRRRESFRKVSNINSTGVSQLFLQRDMRISIHVCELLVDRVDRLLTMYCCCSEVEKQLTSLQPPRIQTVSATYVESYVSNEFEKKKNETSRLRLQR